MPFVAELDADVLEVLLSLARDRGITIDHAANEVLRVGITQIDRQHNSQNLADARSSDWYRMVVDPGISLHLPGMYTWIIDEKVVFIGYFSKISTATVAYENHVRRLASMQGNDEVIVKDLRPIHHTLLRAKLQKQEIILRIFENGDVISLQERCKHLRKSQGL